MGYSATAKAMDTLDRLAALLSPRSSGRPSNGFLLPDGREGFWELGAEQDDGAVVGDVFKLDDDGALKIGTFRIEPNGRISRFPLIGGAVMRKAELL